MAKIELTFRNELRNKSEDTNIVYREFEHLIAQINAIVDELGNNFTTNNLTVNNVFNNNGSNTGTGNLRKATRTLSDTQILDFFNTPLELFTEQGLGTSPGVGFMCVPVRCEFTLDATNGAYANIGQECYLQVSAGAHEIPFGPKYTAAFLVGNSLGVQRASSGMFEPASVQNASVYYENEAIYVWLNNDLGALTGGHQNNTWIIEVWYVIAPTSTSNTVGSIIYTTDARKVYPVSTTRVAVTPSGTSFGTSNWFEIHSSVPTDWAICGIAFNPGADPQGFVRFELGVGAAASEVSIGLIDGEVWTEATSINHSMRWTVPIGGRVPAGSRLAVRMGKVGTNTTNWTVAVEYFEEPIHGNAITCPTVPTSIGGGANIVPSATAFGWSAWSPQTSTNPAASDHLVYGIRVGQPDLNAGTEYEVEIGVGAPGEERTIGSVRGWAMDISTLGTGAPYHQSTVPAYPIIRSGEAVSFRLRKSGTSVTVWNCSACTYPATAMPLMTTEGVQKWSPDGAASLAINNAGVAWNNGTWQVFFTTTVETAITHVLYKVASTVGDVEFDVGTGTPGNEVVVASVRGNSNSIASGWMEPIPLVIARTVAAGSIISLRMRAGSTTISVTGAIGYLESPDFFQRSEEDSIVYPPAATSAAVAGNSSAWADSAYVEIKAATASVVYLTVLNFFTAVNSVHFEIDLATGSAGNEVVIGTFTSYVGDTSAGGRGAIPITPPIRVAINTRIAARWRKEGTATNNMEFTLIAVPAA